jgi:CRP-like cAMP-binding protein
MGFAVDTVSSEFVIWAVSLGALSAVSLPIGSLVGLGTNPRPQFISVMAAFGAGALIAALSVELVAPTVAALHAESISAHHGDPVAGFYALLIGLVAGGIAFVLLDQLVNANGGFLRKTATSVAYFMKAERKRQSELVERLSRLPVMQNVPSEHINTLVAMFRPTSFLDGEVIQEQEVPADTIIYLMEGNVSLSRDGRFVKEFGRDEAIGIASILAGIPHPVTATAKGPVTALALSREDFERLRSISPEFDEAMRIVSSGHIQELEQFESAHHEQAKQWAQEASHALRVGSQIPTAAQLQRARKDHGGAPLAIWLGILLDGIPESIVIGSGLFLLLQTKQELLATLHFTDVIPYTLIAGLFLSNYPEALASSANMKLLKWSKSTIFLMWFSLMVITAIGAGLGYLLAGVLDPTWLTFAEGMAAGAMLTMITSAMIPEAVHMGNANGVGLSTLAGFLAAIAFKLLE